VAGSLTLPQRLLADSHPWGALLACLLLRPPAASCTHCFLCLCSPQH
jgi:hypothetical protein